MAVAVLDHAARTREDVVHRLGCERLDGLARFTRPGAVLWRYRAPEPCSSCRPRLDLHLSTSG